MILEAFKLNEHSPRIVPADMTLCGEIHPEALKFCGPFTHANGAGWWVYPPVDLDITYGNGKFKYNLLSEYPNSEIKVLSEAADKFGSKCILETDNGKRMGPFTLDKTKMEFGKVEPDVWQFWLGRAFRMPPGWGLLVTDPININIKQPFRVQNGIIEVDWLRVDHWINFKWTKEFEWAHIRRDQKYPIAQLIPIPREAYDKKKWELKDNLSIVDHEDVFREWDEYYYQKFVRNNMIKDSSTYHRNRKEYLNGPTNSKHD